MCATRDAGRKTRVDATGGWEDGATSGEGIVPSRRAAWRWAPSVDRARMIPDSVERATPNASQRAVEPHPSTLLISPLEAFRQRPNVTRQKIGARLSSQPDFARDEIAAGIGACVTAHTTMPPPLKHSRGEVRVEIERTGDDRGRGGDRDRWRRMISRHSTDA